jgi:hypothetical protein
LCSKRGRKTHESIPSAKSITIYIHDERKYLQSSITFYARFVLYAYSSTPPSNLASSTYQQEKEDKI